MVVACLSLIIAMASGVTSWSLAEESLETPPAPPQLKGTSFPLEPDKRPERPIELETYIAGATSAPVSESDAGDRLIRRLSRQGDRWGSALDIGLALSNYASKHRFAGSIGSVSTARRAGLQPLSADLRFELVPPISSETIRERRFALSLALVMTAKAGYGRADLKPMENPAALSRATMTDWGGGVGLRIRTLGAGGRHAVWLGADVRHERASMLALSSSLTTVEATERSVSSWVPRLEYKYEPDANWGLELGGGYGFELATSGESSSIASTWRRAEVDARALRHLSPSVSLGFGAAWIRDDAEWSWDVAPGVTDRQTTSDVRVQFLLRQAF